MKKYFNYEEKEKAIKLIEIDPYEAEYLLNRYLQKYPTDLAAKAHLIYVLIVLNKIELAELIIEELEKDFEEQKQTIRNKKYLQFLEYQLKMNRLRILARKRKYQEFLDYANQTSERINYSSWFLPLYKLGQISEQGDLSYRCSQIVNYQESLFLEHAKRHRAINNRYVYKPNNSIFMSDFPLEEIIAEMKLYIPSEQRLCYGYFEDTYTFGYDECGISNGKVVDTFRVISIADDEFHPITMYPVDIPDTIPYIDLNYTKEEKTKTKVLSQIDKFNRRWGQKRN